MPAIAFLNPLFLWALPLAAIPIVIHLLNRRRFKKVPWAAMEYLLAAMKRNRKRLRMEQWVVLLLRTLAVLFLVALVTRPQIGGSSLLGTRTHHVVVLDDSASMTQRSGSTNLFERGQDRVRTLAEDLAQRRGGDLFSIVRTSRPEQPDMWAQRVGPELGRRVGGMTKEWSVTDAAADLGEVMRLAIQRGATQKDAARTEYYLVSDQRARDWTTEDEKPLAAWLAALGALRGDQEHLTVLPVGGQQPNLAVTDVRLADRMAIAGLATALVVEVQNFGLDQTLATNVAVEVDGQSRVSLDVPQLAPGERAVLPLAHTFHGGGYHRVEAQLEASEHYPLDDRRAFALEVAERSRVLVVDGEPDQDEGEAFYVQAAMEMVESGIEPQVVTEQGLAEARLADFDLVWLCNVQSPAPAVAQALEQYVAAGGGLAIACGSLVDAARYDELWWRDGKGCLPLPLTEVAGDPDRPERAVLVDKAHGICGDLAEVLDLVITNAVLVKRWLGVREDGHPGAAIVARIHDAEGPPLLVTRGFGDLGGEVVLLTVSADKFWSNLPSTDLFVPLVNQIHHFAARRRDPSPINLGTSGVFRLELDPGSYRPDVTLRSTFADGEERTFTASEVAPDATAKAAAGEPPPAPHLALTVPMSELRTAGPYEIELVRHDGAPERRMLARNVPIAESRLVPFADAAFVRLYPAELQARVAFARETCGVGSAGGEGEIWRLLALTLLVGLLGETLLAWRFGRR